MPPEPNIVAIPAGKPFADVLAHRLLERYGSSPQDLCRVLVLVPSRRACRSLRDALLRASGGSAMLLPSIQPLGEIEEDELFFTDPTLAGEAAQLTPAVSNAQRRFVLARMIRQHYQSGPRSTPFPQSLLLADALGELIDELYRDNANLNGLETLVPSDFATHWQLTSVFLKKVISGWREYLNTYGLADRVQRQHRLIHLLTRHWQEKPPSHPVIAAGSTGSMPAVRSLLGVIACMPQGMVVLSGLDTHADEAQWQSLSPSHPQFMSAQLLQSIGMRRTQVGVFDDEAVAASSAPEREVLLREAMRPAETLPHWQHVVLDAAKATASLSYHECHTPDEESQLITLLLREVLETPGKTAALVTRDRTLARRVIALMQRYGVALNDSGGVDLATMPAACFLRLAAQCVVAGAAPISLLALLKHPMTRLGMPAARIRSLARLLETRLLRGVRVPSGLGGLSHYIAQHHANETELLQLLRRLEEISAPFFALCAREEAMPDELLKAHLAFAEQLASSDDNDDAGHLWSAPESELLAAALQDALEHAHEAGAMETLHYAAFFDHLLHGHSYRAVHSLHPRLAILSPIEARMQPFDRIILGGMNEGSWPPEPQHSPWMNRAMRQALGLSDLEQRIGQSAHDFCQLALGREVFITRSQQGGDAPSQPARWLVRLNALLHKLQGRPLGACGNYQSYVASLQPPLKKAPLQPPAAMPPARLRPFNYSVSDIETLMRNPYRLYARRILRLKPLDDIDMLPDASHFGQLVHDSFDDFTTRFPRELPADPLAELLESGRRFFAQWWDQPIVRSYWWPRYHDMATQLAAYEQQARGDIRHIFSEIEASWRLRIGENDITLKTRMDRLEWLHGDSWNLIDYKTGTPPESSEVTSGVACQLPLEALILRYGTLPPPLDAMPRDQLHSLSYIKLAGAEQKGEQQFVKEHELRIAEAHEGLHALLHAFLQESQPYYATPFPERQKRNDDYAHLIRHEEWEGSA